ncbi:hypothetical protein ALC60_01304 [Trachymyrmex zeteki]|uniref:Odorant receptor n=1 Tax=Mycetomoellerius zeteki TaxID=64791 RepID=A0A151XH69_9HYME|nr:hypothetical protein ALC60_01304 [Trachymyrmex zeteki]
MRQILLEPRTIEILFHSRCIIKIFRLSRTYDTERMDFKNANFLNTRVNLISGNLLPIVSDNSRFSVIWRIHSAAVWLIELIHTIALIVGMILVPKEKSLKDGTIAVVITLEASFMLTRLYSRKKLLDEIIEKMNDILQSADEIMKDIVKSAIKPITMPFIIYGVTGVITVVIWTIQPILLIFEKSTFYYVDYNLPTAFNNEPFSSRILIFSTIFMTIGSSYLFLKKFGVDVYMMHLVPSMSFAEGISVTSYAIASLTQFYLLCSSVQTLLDAIINQSYSIALLLLRTHNFSMCLYLKNIRCLYTNLSNFFENLTIMIEIYLIYLTLLLRELLSLNFSLMYVMSVFRFCFIGIMFSSVTSTTVGEAISIAMYTSGATVQLYILCSCVQQLLDAVNFIIYQQYYFVYDKYVQDKEVLESLYSVANQQA